jgi:hypothetical protein
LCLLLCRQHLHSAEIQAKEDQRAAEVAFRQWAKRYVPGAEHMNISSQLQIRQLLFPGAVEGGVKIFKAETANYYQLMAEYKEYKEKKAEWDKIVAEKKKAEAANASIIKKAQKAAAAMAAKRRDRKGTGSQAQQQQQQQEGPGVVDVKNELRRVPEVPDEPEKKEMPRRFFDVELHGVWGRGLPGRLTPEAKTAKGTPAVSGAVLKTLAGKPGAAAKALAALREAEAAAAAAVGAGDGGGGAAAAAAAAGGGVSSGNGGRMSAAQLLDDEHDEIVEQLFAEGEEGEAGGGGGKQGQKGSEMRLRVAPWEGVTEEQIKQLEEEAKKKGFGKMYAAMGGGKEGLEACVAMEKLMEVSAIDKLLSAFIEPLQGDNIATKEEGEDNYRVHCSLNLNTETGRLSARRPNLQNQPALEKDRYKVRC